ncbi:Threonine aldolase [Boothiomyces sp. JEL0838]|nr:Threonine aldolase [Boothiomyces sp. JEL0838]
MFKLFNRCIYTPTTIRSRIIGDFRSDTVTKPTADMIRVMTEAAVGDDVLDGDPTVVQLEQQVAQLTGKESALFVTSGTLSNQLAILTHLNNAPQSLICDKQAHINQYEAGAIAFHSRAHTIPIQTDDYITLQDIKREIVLDDDIHHARTRLICLENTLNGQIHPLELQNEISEYAKKENVKMHLDGARLWNASAATKTSLVDLCKPFDSVSLCFSKGMGAPIGSVLVGSEALIRKARHFRKMFGGGWRQAGILAAPCIYAIEHNYPALIKDHIKAKYLANQLQQMGYKLTKKCDTNMVWIDMDVFGLTCNDLEEALGKEGILVFGGSSSEMRLVVHSQITDQAIDKTVRNFMLSNAEIRSQLVEKYNQIKLHKRNTNCVHLYQEAAILFLQLGDKRKADECVREAKKLGEQFGCGTWNRHTKTYKELTHKLFANVNRNCHLAVLSIDLLFLVTKHLSIKEKYRLLFTCRPLYNHFRNSLIFRTLDLRNIPLTSKQFQAIIEKRYPHVIRLNSKLINSSALGPPQRQLRELELRCPKLTAKGVFDFLFHKDVWQSITKLCFTFKLDERLCNLIFDKFVNLEYVDLAGCTGEFELLYKPRRIHTLILAKTSVTDHQVGQFAYSLDYLEVLDISHTRATTKCFQYLKRLTKLRQVDFSGMKETVPINDAVKFIAGCPITTLVMKNSCLQKIDMFKLNTLICDTNRVELMPSDYHVLSLAYCPMVNPEVLKQSPNLQYLDIAHNLWVTDEVIEMIAIHCKQLRVLKVKGCSVGRGLFALNSKLLTLHIGVESRVNEDSLRSLRSKLNKVIIE